MKIKLGLLMAFIAVSAFFVARAATDLDFTGFSWIGNNLQEGVEQGDPVIGMVKFEGEKFQVSLEEEDADGQRLLTGSAWLGIGSYDDGFNDFTDQADLPSIGWIHFDQGVPASGCYGAGDCYEARWNRKPGSTNETEGYISGWAKMEIGPDSLGVPYPDVWVHFKAPADPNNYTCYGTEKLFYTCVDANGRVHGFAWSSGIEAGTIDNNPGLGWIQFSKNYIGVIAAGSKSCSVIAPATRTVCNGVEATYGAYYPSTLNPESYKWKCDETMSEYEEGSWTEGWTKECTYSEDGPVTPSLILTDPESGDAYCTSSPINVVSEKQCVVEVRAEGEGEYSSEVSVYIGDEIEARVVKQCIDEGTTTWGVVEGVKLSAGNDYLNARFDEKQEGKITAEIDVEGEVTTCDEATVNVRDKVKWGQL